MAPGWMPSRPSLAVNKPYLKVLSGSGVLPPAVIYHGSPGGVNYLGNELAFKGLPWGWEGEAAEVEERS